MPRQVTVSFALFSLDTAAPSFPLLLLKQVSFLQNHFTFWICLFASPWSHFLSLSPSIYFCESDPTYLVFPVDGSQLSQPRKSCLWVMLCAPWVIAFGGPQCLTVPFHDAETEQRAQVATASSFHHTVPAQPLT